MRGKKERERIRVIPHGAYEAGFTEQETETDEASRLNELTTDLQGNGYPVNRSEGQEK